MSNDNGGRTMKVLLLNGSPHEQGCTQTALCEVEKGLHENGIETEWMYLGKKAISGCIACGNCKKTGKCMIEDQVNLLHAKLSEINGIVIGSPVYYASAA